jgi:hypothetical protein
LRIAAVHIFPLFLLQTVSPRFFPNIRVLEPKRVIIANIQNKHVYGCFTQLFMLPPVGQLVVGVYNFFYFFHVVTFPPFLWLFPSRVDIPLAKAGGGNKKHFCGYSVETV